MGHGEGSSELLCRYLGMLKGWGESGTQDDHSAVLARW